MGHHESGIREPNINYDTWSDEKKSINLDAKVMNALFCALNKEEFNHCRLQHLHIKYDML